MLVAATRAVIGIVLNAVVARDESSEAIQSTALGISTPLR